MSFSSLSFRSCPPPGRKPCRTAATRPFVTRRLVRPRQVSKLIWQNEAQTSRISNTPAFPPIAQETPCRLFEPLAPNKRARNWSLLDQHDQTGPPGPCDGWLSD